VPASPPLGADAGKVIAARRGVRRTTPVAATTQIGVSVDRPVAGIVFAEHHNRKDRSLPGSATRT
jgi:hypothetical protein